MTALCLAARAELALKDPDAAYRYAAQAVAAAPDHEWPVRLVALAQLRRGRLHEAYDAARSAVALAPQLWQTHHTLAVVCAGMPGMSAVAWDAARRAVELAPWEADTHALMGQIALDSDQKVAERALREALRLDPEHGSARNDLGRLQLRRKDHFGAASHFAQAAASDARLDVAAHNIDVALVAAAGRVFVWVWLVLITLGRVALLTTGDAAWLSGAATLLALAAVVAWHGTQVARGLRGAVGRYVRTLPSRDRVLTGIAVLLVVGVIGLAAMCVLPPGTARVPPLLVGVVALLGCRVLISVRNGRLNRAADATAPPTTSDTDLECADFVFRWLLVGVALFPVFAAVAAIPIDPPSERIYLGGGAAAAAALLLVIALRAHRRLRDGLPRYLAALARRHPVLGAATLLAGLSYLVLAVEGVIGVAGADDSGAVRTGFAWAAVVAYYAGLVCVVGWRRHQRRVPRA